MNKAELEAIASDTAGIYTNEQKTKAQAALADYLPSDGFTVLHGTQPIYPSTVQYFSITVEGAYARELLKMKTEDGAAKEAASNLLLLGLQAKYDRDAATLFCKRFPENAYHLIRVE